MGEVKRRYNGLGHDSLHFGGRHGCGLLLTSSSSVERRCKDRDLKEGTETGHSEEEEEEEEREKP